MFRLFIRQNNITSVSIVLFVILFIVIQIAKPSIIYGKDGSLRQFGLASEKNSIAYMAYYNIFSNIMLFIYIILSNLA